ncbi:NAD(P)-binding protein [Aspergillus steynii IBT 23096]|uniref:NAD(P)-binding protein n=1 Tax=Aspergillus steynii IBT 23096 TaxID=1392250 RepID=A0A2I2G3Y9_9EURO|nr:NAD(P)-binding protein [Aspergillus steynii IBT 23096]PLB47587.1 NAD(P)-binding protein [Aspergillus steynii IBT 23096]
MSPQSTKQWLLTHKPLSTPIVPNTSTTNTKNEPQTFTLTTTPLPTLTKSQALIKTIYISNDPAQRGWISATADPLRLYVPPIELNAVMASTGIGEVIASGNEKALPPGKRVFARTGWSEYTVVEIAECAVIESLPGLRDSHFLGAFGLPGLTAYYGLFEVVKVKGEDSVVVSGAAGAVGSMVVQIAKRVVGCKRVIGIAGSDEKCRWVEKLGADVCINYRKESFEEDLIRETDGFVEVYFDNVGGKILDLMLLRVKRYGRIAACGTIANYNRDDDPVGLKNFYEVISNRISIHGFLIFDYFHKITEAREALVQAWKDGKIEVDDATETVVQAKIEDVPAVWMRLFDGRNTGKLTTEIV